MSHLRGYVLKRMWNILLPQHLQNLLGERNKSTWVHPRRMIRPTIHFPTIINPYYNAISFNMLKQFNELNKLFDTGLPTLQCSDDKKGNSPANKSSQGNRSKDGSSDDDGRVPLSKLKGKYVIAFKCKKCEKRNIRIISKIAYKKGVVIVTCERCGRRHLIADNLNWFPNKGNKRNVEEFLEERGEKVKKLKLYVWPKVPEDKSNGHK